jgi:hypothetical protein
MASVGLAGKSLKDSTRVSVRPYKSRNERHTMISVAEE